MRLFYHVVICIVDSLQVDLKTPPNSDLLLVTGSSITGVKKEEKLDKQGLIFSVIVYTSPPTAFNLVYCAYFLCTVHNPANKKVSIITKPMCDLCWAATNRYQPESFTSHGKFVSASLTPSFVTLSNTKRPDTWTLLCYSPLSFLIRKLFLSEPRRTGRYHFILVILLLVFIHLIRVFRCNSASCSSPGFAGRCAPRRPAHSKASSPSVLATVKFRATLKKY
ncbi:hypothetical protein E2C01_044964 [Portunus trituberculatus]|uniref:Uncharacterized protein n=1 Tax=Portunus trituberculatus TaxID=210409 RepID=A0A5B7G3S1_PORTR|nr:hypothetical protein [Portunus trituberculatus]